MLNKPDATAEKKEAVVIKKYANRRLYNTETSTYVTLDDLATMVRSDRDFVVYDAKTGDDLTHSVLTQIIVEQENRVGGQTLLPIPFLRQLIRFYDDSIERMVPSYLQFSLENAGQGAGPVPHAVRQRLRHPAAAFEVYQEQARKNLAMFEQAMSMWSPFSGVPGAPKRRSGPGQAPGELRTGRRKGRLGRARQEGNERYQRAEGPARQHAAEDRQAVRRPRLVAAFHLINAELASCQRRVAIATGSGHTFWPSVPAIL